ncbi:MAG: hypothetical protein A2X94_04935 [Bdellovibrionales bacterium GWB1_55_8]|nr:MAG: hypothetical protein A2X94_04935 [Bdellovibrionales bacterium GWB1_55_8]
MKDFRVILTASLTILAISGGLAMANEPIEFSETAEDVVRQVEAEFFGKYGRVGEPACSRSNSGQLENLDLRATLNNLSKPNEMAQTWAAHKNQALTTLIQRLEQRFPEWAKSDVVQRAGLRSFFQIDDSKARFDQYSTRDCATDSLRLRANTVHITFTPVGASIIRLSIPKGAGVEHSIMGLGNALKAIKLVPAQRRVLKSFFEAAKRMYEALDVEQKKALKGEKARKVTHRDFMAQASLLIAYHRFLQDTFIEATELSSEYYGVDTTNVLAVKTIDTAIANLVDAYGLESDITSRQIADYGRVLSDLLLYQFSPVVDESKRQKFIRPMIILLAKMTAISEANGDMVARDEVMALKAAWESPAFGDFMADWLTTTDLKLNGLILNMNSLAYKIGLAANVSIKVFEKEDIDRLKGQKARK